MIHTMAKSLISKGHHVRVLLHQANQHRIKNNYTFDGVDVFPPNQNVIDGLIRWSDAIFTHLDYTRWTIHAAKMYRKPVFHLIHNSHPYPEIIDAEHPQYIIYKSFWLKELLNYKFSNFILPPPTDYKDFDLGIDHSANEYLTLINLNKNKGGEIFEQIARAMPNKKFLAVKGSYDDQIIPNLPNVKVVEKSVNIKEYYRQTRVLLMPSEYESYGITATEAMSSGIPVICTDTPGLTENCGKAAIYVKKRDDIKNWVKAISDLDDEKKYSEYSRKGKERAREQDPRKRLEELEKWIREMVYQYRAR
jgi:glycosyltransferase involved in cell wall biosynthesis